jgi:biotin-(acetyl-CoA carboxylase) ligase
MIEVVNTPATQENQVTEATTNTMTLKTPEPTDLLQSLMKLLDEHIEKKIADAVQARIAALEERMNNITTVTDERIREIAEAVATQTLEDHTDEYDHDDYDRVSSNISEIISDAIYDYDFDDKINDAVSSYDMEDKIKDTIRDMTFSVSVD